MWAGGCALCYHVLDEAFSEQDSELGIESLDGIGGVDDPADLFREAEERDDLAPRPAPALADGGVALAPFAGFEGGERLLGSLGIDVAVNALHGTRQRLAELP